MMGSYAERDVRPAHGIAAPPLIGGPIKLVATSRNLLRNLDRPFGRGFFRSGFLLWHYSRIRNHFRDVDRL
jgi:hypothetical protein